MRTTLRIFLALVFLTACQSAQKPAIQVDTSPPESNQLVLDHGYFQIRYSPDFQLAKYVRYTLTAENLKKRSAKRGNKFFKDPFLLERKLPAVGPTAYAKSGYQRGHLAPAEDFRFQQNAIDATFVMSNVAPQKPNLNMGPWKKLEELVRRFACGEGKVTVITGPVLEPDLPKLASGVTIPNRFFKVVIDETPPRKAIAYILHQNDKGNILRERIASENEIKKTTNEDFFADLRTEQETRQPAQINAWREADCH